VSRAARLVAGVLVLLIASAAWAETSDEPERVQPDRPNRNDSTRTVAPGTIQLETGLVYEHTTKGGAPTERRLSAEATIRGGVTERLELRLEGEPIVHLRGEDEDTGRGDLAVSAKYRFFDAPREGLPDIGVEPFVKFPVAKPPLGSGKLDFGALLLLRVDLPWDVETEINLGLTALGQPRVGGYLLQGLGGASFGRDLTERLFAFVEVFAASREERRSREMASVAGGLVYRLARRVAVDGAVEVGVAGPMPDYTLRLGLSARFGP
jgi:outer membrane putative beta-barrel porin/alpha-amylase